MAAHSLLVVHDTLYVGTFPNGDVFRSTNAGATWAQTADLEGVTAVRALLLTREGAIIAGTSPDTDEVFRFYKTTDGGITWIRLADAENATGCINALFETQDGVLLAAGRHKNIANHAIIYVSPDDGSSWQLTQLPVEHDKLTVGQLFFIQRTSDGTIWTGGWAHGPQGILCRSQDDGLTWEWLPALYRFGPDSVYVSRLYDLAEASDGSYILATHPGPDSLCWQSTDGGDTWHLMGPLSGAWEALCLLRASDGTVYAGTSPNGDVFKYVLTGVAQEDVDQLPKSYQLAQNYPNPFNPTTTIRYYLPRSSDVNLSIYNILGQKVAVLANGRREAGSHAVSFSPEGLSSGIYFYRLECASFCKTLKMVLLR
jgi:photosystem II stability/assembly factor-like uncharacterized protein